MSVLRRCFVPYDQLLSRGEDLAVCGHMYSGICIRDFFTSDSKRLCAVLLSRNILRRVIVIAGSPSWGALEAASGTRR